MELRFPPVSAGKCLHYEWFPTKMQCFIYRNWTMVPAVRIAEILGTQVCVVQELAAEMGLPPQKDLCADWTVKGYITLLRANWHLLSCEQLCQLLDWTPAQFAYSLAEDDFLGLKLGGHGGIVEKPDTGTLRYAPLTDAQKAQTHRIFSVTQTALKKFPVVSAKPFDFREKYKNAATRFTHTSVPIRGDRICYSHCALYGDVFSSHERIDMSYPDELLEAYAAAGVNGLWTQAVLYTLTPDPFSPELSAGFEARLEGIRYLVSKLARHGLRLFLYLNEPRSRPLSFFEGREELTGVEDGETAALCLSVPAVQDYLRSAVSFLVRNVPGLGGIFTITASENLTNCYSRTFGGPCQCPRCAARPASEYFALANRLIYEGAVSADPDFRVIAWTWGWQEDQVHETIRLLPLQIAVMGVSEQYCQKQYAETCVRVLDYSISIEGPGRYALDTWQTARETSHSVYAKVQLNNSWEMAAVPYIPVFEKVYRHLRALFEKAQPDGLLLSWTLGGYPSPTLRMLECFQNADGTLPTLEMCYAHAFPGADIQSLKTAFHLFSEAFGEFPFDVQVLYCAPQHIAPANLLFDRNTGYEATMVCYSYDDLTRWRSIFPEEEFIEQLKKLSDQWNLGVLALRSALCDSQDDALQEILLYAQVCQTHFRSLYLQCCFVRDRERGILRTDILDEESDIAVSMANLMARDPLIGYEPSNHYFYTQQELLEKVLCCEYWKEKYRFAEEKTCNQEEF